MGCPWVLPARPPLRFQHFEIPSGTHPPRDHAALGDLYPEARDGDDKGGWRTAALFSVFPTDRSKLESVWNIRTSSRG